MARLLDVLREELNLTGTKEGCGEGECGACSVFINGKLVNSCLVPVAQLDGAEITTIEGVSAQDVNTLPEFLRGVKTTTYSVQEAFLKHGGAQCGICTPGMIMASVNILNQNPNPSEEDLRRGLAGNLCRCTGYTKIFESLKKVEKRSESLSSTI